MATTDTDPHVEKIMAAVESYRQCERLNRTGIPREYREGVRQAIEDALRETVAVLPCMRQWNQSPKCLSCTSLKRLREDGPNPWTPTELCPTCLIRERSREEKPA